MNANLKIGSRLLDSGQLISALVQYKLFEDLIGQVIVDQVIETISLSQQEVFWGLVGNTTDLLPENFEAFVHRWCDFHKITPQYFNAVILRDLKVEKFKQIAFANQVESEFFRARSELDQVEYSVIRVVDAALAQELYFHLRDDAAEFTQLAQHYSQGSERESGGWVGPVAIASLPPEVIARFRSAVIGQVLEPLRVGEEIWLLRLEHRTLARLSQATRTLIINRLYQRWLQSHIRTAMATPGAIALTSTLPNSPQNLQQKSIPAQQ